MAGHSTTSKPMAFRIPLDVVAAMHAAVGTGSVNAWVIDAIRTKLGGSASPVEMVVAKGVKPRAANHEDQVDGAIAAQRLREIAAKPESVIRGDALQSRLDRWTDGLRCRKCGFLMRAGRCSNRGCH